MIRAGGIVALILCASLPSRGADLPRCSDEARFARGRQPYPCDVGWSWNLTLGPFAAFRTGQDLKAGHYGAELSFLAGPMTEDGSQAMFRSYLLGAVLDLGYLSAPSSFRVALEAQISSLFLGLSAGPSLRVGSGETVAGGSFTVWAGFVLYVYGRYSIEHPSRSFGEVGGMIKIPLRWR